MKHRRSLLHIFILTTITLLFASCSDEPRGPIEGYDYEKFDGVIYRVNLRLNDAINAALADFGMTDADMGEFAAELRLIRLANIEYEVTAISYNTTDVDGRPTKASGVIYYPKKGHPKGVVEISPINQSKATCTSAHPTTPDALPSMIGGYICIIPDLLGCGITEDMPIEYLQHKNIAIISADLRQAAEEYLYTQHRHRMSRQSILFGYSLGGPSIMELAREYQLNSARGVTVKSVFTGGGTFDPSLVFDSLISTGRSDYAVIPNVLWSINYYDRLSLDFSRIFKGPLLENYQDWCSGYLHINELTAMLGTDPSAYLADEFVAGYASADEYATLRQTIASKRASRDWSPKTRIYLCHADADYYVPRQCTDEYYEYLKSVGANVSYKIYEGDHIDAGKYMVLDFTKYLLTAK